MIYKSNLNLPVIKVKGKAYQIKVDTKRHRIKDREAIKEGLNCSTVIEDNNSDRVLFCRKIEEATILEEYSDEGYEDNNKE